MRDKRKLILIFVLLIGSFILYIIFFRDHPEVKVDPASKLASAAQDFGLYTLKGDYVKLSDYRGKVVFLNIWATWCPPCREEIPSIDALYQRLKGREFEMLAVSVDREGERVVRPFVDKYGLRFPVLLDPDNKTYRLYGLTGVPETFIIDKNGVVINKIIGPQNWMKDEWLNYFDHIIG